MKILYCVYVATADLSRIVFRELFKMFCDIEFFRRTKHEVNAGNCSNFIWFQLRITTGNYYEALWCFALNSSYNLPAFLIGIIGNGTGIDNVDVGVIIKFFLVETIVFQQTGKR